MRSFPVHILVPLQGFAAMTALVGLSMSPPASGRIMVVPLTEQAAGNVTRATVAGGALLLGAGPIPGSLIVLGERANIARHLAAWHVVLLAAPPTACGDVSATTPG